MRSGAKKFLLSIGLFSTSVILVGSIALFSDLSTAQTPISADLNRDGVVDFLDVDELKSAFFTSDPDRDLNVLSDTRPVVGAKGKDGCL